MPSTTTNTVTPDLDAATDRIREANDRIFAAGRKVTAAYLDGVEQYITGYAKAERKFGEQAQIDAVGQLITAHADLTENVVKASVAATRELVTA
jgi:hypothetical protein